MSIQSIKKRDGRLVAFDESKIAGAINKAFYATYKPGNEDTAKKLADEVLSILEVEGELAPDVEHIQDIVERVLMDNGYVQTAKAYILYRAERNRIREMDHLKAKRDEGADYICTQLFFDNHAFFDYRDRCRLLGIDVPIIAGIMPVTSISSMNRMAELSAGTNFPARLLKAMLRAGGDKQSIERIGINYASNQCSELLDADVDGIHFYTLNRSKATLEIYRNLGINNYFDVDRIHMLNDIYNS